MTSSSPSPSRRARRRSLRAVVVVCLVAASALNTVAATGTDDAILYAHDAVVSHDASGNRRVKGEVSPGTGDTTIGYQKVTRKGQEQTITEPAPGDHHRWGLHVTVTELEEWRRRAVSGPYRVKHDVSDESPGDWERILRHRDAFLADPDAGRWHGPPRPAGECIQKRDELPPVGQTNDLRDAAFASRVLSDTDLARVVAAELLAQARDPGVDFTDRSRWCTDILYDINPGFDIANWLTKLLYAYDYVGPDRFTPSQVDELDAWFVGAAEYFQIDLDVALSKPFVDRANGDLRITQSQRDNPFCNKSNYVGGPPNCQVSRRYNNRFASIARFVALVGVHQSRPDLALSGRKFVEELLAFWVYPDGSTGEFERWVDRLPDLGWGYSTATLASAITIADAFARAGDTSLYTYQTTAGAFGTESTQPKSLRTAIDMHLGYVNGRYQRYAGPIEGPVNANYLIDGEHEDWHAIHDVMFAPANRYFRDAALTAAYTRTDPRMRPYPDRPAATGPNPVWMGDWGTFPAVLFMFGQP